MQNYVISEKLSPFNEMGSVAEIFDMSTWIGIKSIIDNINRNTAA